MLKKERSEGQEVAAVDANLVMIGQAEFWAWEEDINDDSEASEQQPWEADFWEDKGGDDPGAVAADQGHSEAEEQPEQVPDLLHGAVCTEREVNKDEMRDEQEQQAQLPDGQIRLGWAWAGKRTSDKKLDQENLEELEMDDILYGAACTEVEVSNGEMRDEQARAAASWAGDAWSGMGVRAKQWHEAGREAQVRVLGG